MLSIIVGIVLVLGGPAWASLSWLAASMADRGVDFLHDIFLPGLLPGLIAVVAGGLLIWFR